MKRKFLSVLVFTFCLMIGVKTISANTYDDYLNKIAPEGKIIINSVAPTSNAEKEAYIKYYMDRYRDPEYSIIGRNNAAQDGFYEYEICKYRIENNHINCDTVKTGKLPIEYDESKVDSNIAEKVKEYIANFPKGELYNGNYENVIKIDDMELISYYSRFNDGRNVLLDITSHGDIVNYNNSYKEMIGNVNIANYYTMNGNGMDIGTTERVNIVFAYNGVIYGIASTPIRQILLNAIYIDESTSDDTDSIIKAVQKRLDDNLGNGVATIKLDSTNNFNIYFDEMQNDYLSNYKDLQMNEAKVDKNIYTINIGGYAYKFFVIKDSSKIKDLANTKTVDFITSSSVEFNTKYSPADSTISIMKYNDEENKEYLNKLNLINGETYEVDLFSKSANKYITKVNDSKFIVSIPVDSSLANKKLVAYYINSNNEIEEHDVTVKDGVATFETDHFSIYTLGTNSNENIANPETFDGIFNWIILSIISLLGISSILVYKKKRNI